MPVYYSVRTREIFIEMNFMRCTVCRMYTKTIEIASNTAYSKPSYSVAIAKEHVIIRDALFCYFGLARSFAFYQLEELQLNGIMCKCALIQTHRKLVWIACFVTTFSSLCLSLPLFQCFFFRPNQEFLPFSSKLPVWPLCSFSAVIYLNSFRFICCSRIL